MHRSAGLRAFVGAWLLWFTATMVQSPLSRVCPIHGAMAHAAMHHMSAGMSHHGSGTTGHAGCDCPDAYRCGAPALAPVAIAFRLPAPALLASAEPASTTTLAFALLRAHALPFANAPPPSPGPAPLA